METIGKKTFKLGVSKIKLLKGKALFKDSVRRMSRTIKLHKLRNLNLINIQKLQKAK